AAASNEQAQGIMQINTGLSQVDKVTQQNTANAEESASASQELNGQAGNLREMLTQFTLKNGARAKRIEGRAKETKKLGEAKKVSQEDARAKIDKAREEYRQAHDKNESDDDEKSEKANKKSVEADGVKMVSPDDVIKLDDDEFGKYSE
ncbi:MAG: hypothetical protein GF419_14150, partial [Ignavibacteriales bacterium]|nr:hypothetical protein [Ignavibacteriales bacterium]